MPKQSFEDGVPKLELGNEGNTVCLFVSQLELNSVLRQEALNYYRSNLVARASRPSKHGRDAHATSFQGRALEQVGGDRREVLEGS